MEFKEFSKKLLFTTAPKKLNGYQKEKRKQTLEKISTQSIQTAGKPKKEIHRSTPCILYSLTSASVYSAKVSNNQCALEVWINRRPLVLFDVKEVERGATVWIWRVGAWR